MAELRNLLQTALVDREKPALTDGSKITTGAQLWQNAEVLANTLADLGFKRLGLAGDNGQAWHVADLACLMASVVSVPLPPFFSRKQTDHIASCAALDGVLWVGNAPEGARPLAEGLFFTTSNAGRTSISLPPGTCKITFTSGSTGSPKGVCLGESQLAATTEALAHRLAAVGIEKHLNTLPLATLLENIAGGYLPLLMGATITSVPMQNLGMRGSSGLSVNRWASAINDHRPHSLILVPELAMALVQAAKSGLLRYRGFRFLAVGGGKVSPGLLRQAREMDLPLYEGYGLSECGSVVSLNAPGLERFGSVGRPLGHVSVRVDDHGEIRVTGKTFLGYLNDTAEAGSGVGREVATGDLGCMTSDGFLRVNGRAKNLLITSFGRNINPEWLESELLQCPGIAQAWVFGDGQAAPEAFLVLSEMPDRKELRDQLLILNSNLPDYARLQAVHCLNQPFTQASGYLTANGRLRRQRLLDDLAVLCGRATTIQFNTRGADMNFFERLQKDTAVARQHVSQAPVIQAIQEGRFDLDSYTWFLTQAFHHVKHTVPLMMACGGRLPERLEFVRKALVEYIDEEYGHQEWILNDLEACGVDKASVRQGLPDKSIELMVAYLYDQINRGNPAAFFGMVQVLEGTSVELATPLGQQIQQQLELPTEAFSYLYSHGALDQDHFEFFKGLMSGITRPEDQEAIIRSSNMVYRLYGDMLHSIPLPQYRKEACHEVA
ncbi:AMP-binding protein [Marinobacter halotolerans]|uniref:AMP-binding protein n=1 Tax=Marinobacter halotolerans TaxID=1569211 RepID=UPI0012484FFD|nr:AMP-binding protein [Marinobacter halotolerans]